MSYVEEIKSKIKSIIVTEQEYMCAYRKVLDFLHECKKEGLQQDSAKEIFRDLIGDDNKFLTDDDDILLSIYYIVCGFCSPKDDIWHNEDKTLRICFQMQNNVNLLGKSVEATIVRKESQGLFFEYKSRTIFVQIVGLTDNGTDSNEYVRRAIIGSKRIIKIFGYDSTDDQFQGTLGKIIK